LWPKAPFEFNGNADSYAFGWLTGPDSDLICLRPNITDNYVGAIALSPTNDSRFLAIVGFFLKYILFAVDQNIRCFFKALPLIAKMSFLRHHP